MLHGQLIFSSLNTAPINIVNVSTHQGTINDENGTFKIEVSLGDELLFSSLQYAAYHLSITQELIDKRWIRVEMIVGVNKLEPVTISSIDLIGNLKTDLNSVGIEKYYNNTSFGLPEPAPAPTVEERRLYTATTSIGGGVPVDMILNAISGRLKKLNKLKEYSELDQWVEKALHSMEIDFFISECGVPEKYITSFLYFCAMDEGFENKIRLNAKLILVNFFKNKAKIFKNDYLKGRS